MSAAAKANQTAITPAALISATVGNTVEPLESRVLFAAGDLDTSFNGTGQLTLDYFGRNDFANAVAVQSDNKVLVAGTAATGTTTGADVTVARFNADGSLDTSFGVGGRVVTHLGSTGDSAFALAVQSDGRVVLAGGARAGATATDFALVRYNADGSLDNTFGTDGIVRTDFGASANDLATAMTILADGRIMLAGWTSVIGEQHFAAARYTSSGALDTSFGGDGTVVAQFAGGAGQAKALATLADGSIVLAGTLMDHNGFGSDYAAIRLLADGTLDTSFGSAGWATVHLGGESERANGVVVTGDGRVVLVGESSASDHQLIGVARLTSDGQLDATFGAGEGYVLTNFAGGINWGSAAHLQSDGKIVIAGSATVNGLAQFAVARYNPDGSLDASFGAGGTVVHHFAAGESFGKALVVDSQQRLVIAGNVAAGSGNSNVGVMRLENTLPNMPPVAQAGGAYLVNAGSTIVLDGSGSSDADGSIVSYDWDFDYDGNVFDIDATGATAIYVAGAAGTRTVALRVTDNNGATSVVATALVSINALPIADAGGPYTVVAGSSIMLNGGGSSDVDGSIVAYEWDFDYDGTTFDADAVGATPTFDAPANAGGTTRTVALRCIDNHGATHITTTTITIDVIPSPLPPPPAQGPGTAVLVNDPTAPGKTTLSVKGTSGSDSVRFKTDKKGNVEVRLGNKKLGTFSGMTRVVIDAGAGNDVIDARHLNVPVALFGGAGNDVLIGSNASDILIGGAGDDVISGGRGNNVIVGGAGRDVLPSMQGNDLLIGGSLSFENDLSSMSAVLAEWSRTDHSLSQRISSLMNGGGKNGFVKLSGNVMDDNTRDSLFGTTGADWLLSGTNDRVQRIGR